MFLKIVYGLSFSFLWFSLIESSQASHAEGLGSSSMSLAELNQQTMVYLPHPDKPEVTVPMTCSFAYDQAIELLKDNDNLKNLVGARYMTRLFEENYGPVIELFDNVCDMRKPITKDEEEIKRLLKEHYAPSKKSKGLGGWGDDDE